MSNLKSRIERIEKRIAIDETRGLTLIELLHYMKLHDPEEFRRDTMAPVCPDRWMRQEVLDSPTPKKVIRYFRRWQLEQQTNVPASSSDRTRETSPEEKHESAQSPGRKPK